MSQAKVKKQNIDMTQGTPWKVLLAFAMPLLLGNVFQVLYNTVDSIVVGQYVGSTALAAVGTAMPTINLLLALFNGIATGATIMIAQYYGAQRYDDVFRANSTIMIMTFAIGIFMSVFGVISAPYILKITNVPDDVFDQALSYMRIFIGGVVFMMFYNIISGILRGLGDSKRPLYFLIISCCVNIVLDLL
ncbi:MAG: polysaccharide biosynthesis C-terminal domain-containing protein, partial [Clostridia bacterium]|nr:polysaccharide biosynthesis C-terminal domain-containing protein [Clostridia bacterium]